MKSIRVSLDERIVSWARFHAAQRNMGLSRFIGEVLRDAMVKSRAYEGAMQRYLARKPVALKGAQERYPTRKSLYEPAG